MSDFTICIGTFGSEDWIKLAEERAIPSAEAQGVPVIHRHGETLAQARNACLGLAETDMVVFLDADDELEPGYIEAMAGGTADLRAPSLRQVREYQAGREVRPFMPQVGGRNHRHECTGGCLRDGNWLVVGTAVRRKLLLDVGGFPEGIDWSEDWAAWALCWKAGGTVEAIPEAVYRAYVRLDSRNHAPSAETKNHWHREIEKLVWPEEVAA
jgi:hypothetical protein